MATLAANVQRFGVNLQSNSVALSGSSFDVAGSKVTILDSAGNFKSYTNGASSFLNTTSVIPAFSAFQLFPKASITVDDNLFSFGTVISTGSEDEEISPNEYNLVLITGQSNATGANSESPLTVRQPFQNLSFSGGTFFAGGVPGTQPLKEGNASFSDINTADTQHSETIASACVNFLTTLTSRNFFVINVGKDGVPYSGIKKGGVSFQHEYGLTGISNAKTTLASNNKTLNMAFSVLRHGEADDNLQTPNYDALIAEHQANIETDTKAITGQTGIVPLFLCQMNNWTKNNRITSSVCNAQLTAIENNPGKVFGTQPKYHSAYQLDGVHLTAAAQREGGYYYAWAVYQNLYLKRVWYPLIPLKSVYNAAAGTITITYNVPDGGMLEKDTAIVTDPGSLGFKCYKADDTVVEINSIEMSENSIRINVNSDDVVSYVRYALDGINGAAAGATTGARGCIRGSFGIPNLERLSLYHWSWAFQKSVNFISNLITSNIVSNPVNVGTFTTIFTSAATFTIAGTVQNRLASGISGLSNLWGGDVSADGNTFYVAGKNTNVYAVNLVNQTSSIFLSGLDINVMDFIVDSAGNNLYALGGTKIKKITLPGKVVTDLATGFTDIGHGNISPDGSKIYAVDGDSIISCNTATGVIVVLGSLPGVRCVTASLDGLTLYALHDSSGIYTLPSSGGTPTIYQANVGGWGICTEPVNGRLIVARLGASDIIRIGTPTPSLAVVATGVSSPIVVRARGINDKAAIYAPSLGNAGVFKII